MPYAKPYAQTYPWYCIAIQHCGFVQAKQVSLALPRLPSIPRHAQSPSKAPNQASKAPKSASLGQRIARQLCRLLGPLFKPHQNGANGPLVSMVSSVY